LPATENVEREFNWHKIILMLINKTQNTQFSFLVQYPIRGTDN
jgi:hypothetical protein